MTAIKLVQIYYEYNYYLLTLHFLQKYQYLLLKYGLTEADRYINIDHLLGKVRKKMSILYPKPIVCNFFNRALCHT